MNNPYWELIGLKKVSSTNGNSILELPITKKITQRNQTVHGGVLASMIDAAIGHAIRSKMHFTDHKQVTVELSVNYLREASGNKLTAKGKIIKKGNSISVGYAEILNDAGDVISVGIGTFKIIN